MASKFIPFENLKSCSSFTKAVKVSLRRDASLCSVHCVGENISFQIVCEIFHRTFENKAYELGAHGLYSLSEKV